MKKLFTILLALLLTTQVYASSALNFGNLGVSAVVKSVAWSGTITADTTSWATSSGTIADFSSGTTIVASEKVNNGFGTVTCGGSDLAQCVISSVPESGQYQVCYNASAGVTGVATAVVLLADGSNNQVVAPSTLTSASSGYVHPVGGCGLVTLAKGASYTLKLRGQTNGSSLGLRTQDASLPIIGMSIIMVGGGAGAVTPWEDKSSIFSFTSFGTVSDKQIKCRRVGDSLECRGYFASGTAVAADASIDFTEWTMDTAKMAGGARWRMGNFKRLATGTGGEAVRNLFYDGSDNNSIFFSLDNSATPTDFNKTDGTGIAASGDYMTLEFTFPVVGW